MRSGERMAMQRPCGMGALGDQKEGWGAGKQNVKRRLVRWLGPNEWKKQMNKLVYPPLVPYQWSALIPPSAQQRLTGSLKACSLIYLFIYFPRLLAPTRAARGAWLRGNVCYRQHTLGITSTPFRAFRPNSCCCISLNLQLLVCVGQIFLRSGGLWVWGIGWFGEVGEKNKVSGEFIILSPLPWPYPNLDQERKKNGKKKKITSSC